MERRVVSRDEWLREREALLAAEKDLARQRDRVAAQRRSLPWVKVEAPYTFEGPGGRIALADLFGPRSQLVAYHFMYGPGEAEPCPLCSFWADNFERNVVHLAARDTALVAISRGELPRLLAFRERMGWTFPWYSSHGTSFNRDLGVSFFDDGPRTYNYRDTTATGELPGISVFARDGRDVFHTYSTYARGLDPMNAAYQYLDLTPKGRDEDALGFSMAWVRYRDRYV